MKLRYFFCGILILGVWLFFINSNTQSSIPTDSVGIAQGNLHPEQPAFSSSDYDFTSDALPYKVQENQGGSALAKAKDFDSSSDFSLSANNEVLAQQALYLFLSRFVHSSASYQKRFFAPLVHRYLLFENWRK